MCHSYNTSAAGRSRCVKSVCRCDTCWPRCMLPVLVFSRTYSFTLNTLKKARPFLPSLQHDIVAALPASPISVLLECPDFEIFPHLCRCAASACCCLSTPFAGKRLWRPAPRTYVESGRNIRVYVGEPIDVRPIIDKCRVSVWCCFAHAVRILSTNVVLQLRRKTRDFL